MSQNEFTKANQAFGLTKQVILDAGLNVFALELLVESFTKTAGDKTDKVQFVFCGVTVGLQIGDNTARSRTIVHPLTVDNKRAPIQQVLMDLAAQENCDGEPYNQMIAAAKRIDLLEATLEYCATSTNRDMAKAAYDRLMESNNG